MGNNAPNHSQALGRPALCQGLGCIDKSLSPLEPLPPLSLTLLEFSAFRHNTGTPGRGTTKNRILTFLLPEWLKDFFLLLMDERGKLGQLPLPGGM